MPESNLTRKGGIQPQVETVTPRGVTAAKTAVASLSGIVPTRRFDDKPWISARIDGAAQDGGPWKPVETFVFGSPLTGEATLGPSTDPSIHPVDQDPSNPFWRSFTTQLVNPATTHWLRVVFIDENGDEDPSASIQLNAAGSLAQTSDIATRLGRDLTDAETGQANLLIGFATTTIIAVLGCDPMFWIPPAPVRPLLSMLCVEMVTRVVVNPEDLQRRRETIGSYTIDEMFAPRAMIAPGIYPTPTEELLIRNAVFGSNSASVKLRGMVDDYAQVVWSQAEIQWALYYGPMNNPSRWV